MLVLLGLVDIWARELDLSFLIIIQLESRNKRPGWGGGILEGDSWVAGTGKWNRKAEAKVTASTEELEVFLLGPQKNLSTGSKREEHLHPYTERVSPLHHC